MTAWHHSRKGRELKNLRLFGADEHSDSDRSLLSCEVGIQGLGSVSWSSKVASPSCFSAADKATDSVSVTGTVAGEQAASGTSTVNDEDVGGDRGPNRR